MNSVPFLSVCFIGKTLYGYRNSLYISYLDKEMIGGCDSYSCDSSFLMGVNFLYIIYNYLYIN